MSHVFICMYMSDSLQCKRPIYRPVLNKKWKNVCLLGQRRPCHLHVKLLKGAGSESFCRPLWLDDIFCLLDMATVTQLSWMLPIVIQCFSKLDSFLSFWMISKCSNVVRHNLSCVFIAEIVWLFGGRSWPLRLRHIIKEHLRFVQANL